MILEFNEEALKEELGRLPQPLVGAFAASCAQRLATVCNRFARKNGWTDQSDLIDQARHYVWTHILAAPEAERTDMLLESVMAMIPGDEEPDWTPLTAYAEDGLSSLAYCLRWFQSGGDPQEAAWAARNVYEAVDQFVINQFDVSPYEPGGEARLLSNSEMQRELARQARDLADVKSAGGTMSPEFLDGLRERSTAEQAIVLNDDD